VSLTEEQAVQVDLVDLDDEAILEVENPIIYKTYKRRWIGVVNIMLLNIISSWRYECCFGPCLTV
jgi:hypothetical protein